MQTPIYTRVSKSDGSQDIERQLVKLGECAIKKLEHNQIEVAIYPISDDMLNNFKLISKKLWKY